MATMGRYCKAYPLERLRAFPGWYEAAGHARPDDGDPAAGPRALTGDAVVYVQEDYTVTDGIFRDEHVLFDAVTPEWKTFCHDVLHFEIPAAPNVSGR